MKVSELMIRNVRTCVPDNNLNRAAQLMWEGDCGVVPVIGADGAVVGMVTDRDICMAAYTKGKMLSAIRVGDVMANQVSTCSLDSTLETAMSIMKEIRVRRLPVVDAQGKLAGILSLNDLAIEARKQTRGGGRDLDANQVTDTLGIICDHRRPDAVAAKPQGKRAGELVGARS
jgi:CBS-domain-containing membrane protein